MIALTPGQRVGKAGCPPLGTKISCERSGQTTHWHIPATGRSHLPTGFAWVWMTMVAVLTFFVCYIVIFGKGNVSKPVALLVVGLFVLPFWIVGLTILYRGYRAKLTRHRVTIDAQRITLASSWLGKTKESSLAIADLQAIHQTVQLHRNRTPIYGIEILGNDGNLHFGNNLTHEEKPWLVAELREGVWPKPIETQPIPSPPPTFHEEAANAAEPFSLPVPASRPNIGVSLFLGLFGGFFAVVGWFMFRDGWGVDFDASLALRIFDLFMTLGRATVALVMFLISAFALISAISLLASRFRNQHVEQWLEGTAHSVTLRKSSKGLSLGEQTFPRDSFRDIRTEVSVSGGRILQKRIKLLIGGRSITIVDWVNGEEAEAFAEEARRKLL